MSSSLDETNELWEKAFKALHPSVRDQLNASRTAKLDIIRSVLKTARAKHDITLKKKWKVKKANGDEIIIRDILEKIIVWVQRFRDVGDIAVQYSPAHASIPWAAIRFVLQAAVSEAEVFGSFVEGLELITRLIVRFREFEKLFIPLSDPHDHIEEALVRLYTTILQYLAEAVTFFSKSTTPRLLQSPFHKSNHELLDQISKQENEALKIADLVQVQRLLVIESQINRLQIESEESQKVLSKERHSTLLRWLSPVPYLRHHQDHQKTRVQNTGDWLLQNSMYQAWTTSSISSIFFLHGIAGSGKTKVCSAVIDQYYLSSPSARSNVAPVAFFYCGGLSSEPERCSSVGVLKSLVRQLATKTRPNPSVHHTVSTIYKRREDEAEGFDLTTISAPECVSVILEVLEDNPAYLIVDAIDELEDPSNLLDALFEIQVKARNIVKVFVTSRDSSQILAMIPQTALRFRIGPGTNAVDVRSYAVKEVTAAKHTRKLLLGDIPADLEHHIIDSLCSGADEMFLWVKLQIDELTRLRKEEDVRNSLSKSDTPTINELFALTVGRILNGGGVALDLATRTFAWLLYMREPLSQDTFRSAISLDGPVIELQELLNVCHNLIYLDSSLQVFRFAHHSIQQYLREQPFLIANMSQQILASSCLSICSTGPPEIVMTAAPKERLYDYAAMYWGHHCAFTNASSSPGSLYDALNDFLFTGDQLGPAGYVWMDHVQKTRESLSYDHPEMISYNVISNDEFCPLLPICVYGLSSVLTNHGWSDDFNFDQRNSSGQTALYLASFFGHQGVVEYLLDHNADVNVRCGKFESPLHCAAFRGHLGIARMLLRNGADPSHGRWDSVIHAALSGNHEELALGLLKSDVQIETLDQLDSLLQATAEAGTEAVMTFLLTHSLRVGGKTDRSLEMLTRAINSGKVSSIKALQRVPHLAGTLPKTGLANSASRGYAAMTTYLLDQGLDPNGEGELGSPLRCASLNGHLEVCQILLRRGADVDKQCALGSPLHAACMKGHSSVVRLLVESGANVNQQGGHYGTPAQAAAFQNHAEILDHLERSGADLHASGLYTDVLCAAFAGCGYEVVNFLLKRRFSSREKPAPVEFCAAKCEPSRDVLRESLTIKSESRRSRKSETLDAPDALDTSTDSDSPRTSDAPDALEDFQSLETSDSLVLAARSGRVDILDRLLDTYDLSSHFSPNIKSLLLQAYKRGHSHIVSHLLIRPELDRKSLLYILKTAAKMNDRITFDEVLQRTNELMPNAHHDQDIVISSLPSLQIFRLMFKNIEDNLSSDKLSILLKNCLWIAASEGYMDNLSDCLLREHSFEQMDLMLAFELACIRGQEKAVPLLYTYLTVEDTATEAVLDSMWRALDRKNLGIAIFLLDCLVQRGAGEHASQFVLHAARQGILELLEASFKHRFIVGEETYQTALNVAASYGHGEICQLLIKNGAKPSLKSQALTFQYVSYKLPRQPKEMMEAYFEGSTIYHAQGVSRLDDQKSQTQHLLTPIESCLQGCEAGHNRKEFTHTMMILSRSADAVSDSIFARAVAISPHKVVRSLIQSGANVDTIIGDSSIVEIAAQREYMQFPLVKDLLNGKDQSGLTYDLYTRLLEHSLDKFNEPQKFGFFAETPSLSDIFSTGPGATIKFLLRYHQGLKLPRDTRSALYLQCAVAANEEEVVKTILEHDVDVNTICGFYGTALQAASWNGYWKIADMLIEAHADPNNIAGHFGTALQAAAIGGHRRVTDALLAKGADVNLYRRDNQLDKEISIDKPAPDSFTTPLILAIKNRHLEIADDLIQAGADPNLPFESETSALIEACETGEERLVAILLGAGAQVNAVGHDIWYNAPRTSNVCHVFGQRTALHNAIATGNPRLVQTLLDHGFDLTIDSNGTLPLLGFAADRGYSGILSILFNAMPDVPAEILSTGLRQAIYTGDLNNVEIFLSKGALICSSASDVNCLRAAFEISNLEVLECLLEKLAQTEDLEYATVEVVRDTSMECPRHFELMLDYVLCPPDLFVQACARGWIEVVQLALAQRIDVNAEDSKGRVAIHFAAAFGRVDIVKLLLDQGANVHQTLRELGNPLVTALESLVSNRVLSRYKLSPFDVPGDIRSRVKFIFGIEAEDFSWMTHYIYQRKPSQIPQTGQIAKVVSLLMSSGTHAMSYAGPFGYPVHIAAFLGHPGIFNLVVDEESVLNTRGNLFETPLEAAIEGDSMEIVKQLVQLIIRSPDEEIILGNALVAACRAAQPRGVKILLTSGADANFRTTSEDTPFDALISQLSSYYIGKWEEAGLVLDLLLGAPLPLRISDYNINKIIQTVKNTSARDGLLQRLFVKIQDLKISAETVIKLMKDKNPPATNHFVDYLLITKRFPAVTEEVLITADVKLIPQLLEYDPSCSVTSSLIGAIPDDPGNQNYLLRTGDPHARISALIQHSSLVPNEEDIIKLCSAAEHCHHGGSKKSNLNDILDRNPDLCVTQGMLSAARNEDDLNVLLDRITPDHELLTENVFRNAAINGTLEVLLERHSGGPIPRKIAVDGIKRHPLASLRLLKRVLALDPGFPIYEHVMLALFVRPRPVDKILTLLKVHQKRFIMTERVKRVIDDYLNISNTRDTLLEFYKLADGESGAPLDPPELEAGEPITRHIRIDVPFDEPDYPIEDGDNHPTSTRKAEHVSNQSGSHSCAIP